MAWLIRRGYVLFAAGVLTPIFGAMLDRHLHSDRPPNFAYLAAALCLLGLLALSMGRRDRGGHSRGNSSCDAR
jgi:hypothetical protein